MAMKVSLVEHPSVNFVSFNQVCPLQTNRPSETNQTDDDVHSCRPGRRVSGVSNRPCNRSLPRELLACSLSDALGFFGCCIVAGDMLDETNIIAVVSGESVGDYTRNHVALWDDSSKVVFAKLTFRSEVIHVKLRYDRCNPFPQAF